MKKGKIDREVKYCEDTSKELIDFVLNRKDKEDENFSYLIEVKTENYNDSMEIRQKLKDIKQDYEKLLKCKAKYTNNKKFLLVLVRTDHIVLNSLWSGISYPSQHLFI